MPVAELPTELLARILLKVARPDAWRTMTATPGLVSLARAACVSRAWRAASEAAAAHSTVELCDWRGSHTGQGLPVTALPSAQVHRWACHWRELHIGDAGYLRAPSFRDFLREHCTRLEDLHLNAKRDDNSTNLVSHAYLESAAAALPGLPRLTCSGFIPASGLPPALERLRVRDIGTGEHDLAALLLRLQPLQQLQEVDIESYGYHMHLCTRELTGLQLPQLKHLQLWAAGLTAIHSWDLRWLAQQPRSFRVTLAVSDEWSDTTPEDWEDWAEMPLEQSFLQPHDTLGFLAGSNGMSFAAQRLLHQLHLAEVEISVFAGISVYWLPRAPCVKLHLLTDSEDKGKQLSISWAALTFEGARRVSVAAEDCFGQVLIELQVSGYAGPHCMPDKGPWRLSIEGPFTAIRGLPPATSASKDSYILLNQAAIDAG